MSSWLQQTVGACWDSVAVQLPQLQSQLSALGHSIMGSLGGGAAAAGSDAIGAEYELRGRRFRVLRQLGEGGYSFVYLVKEVPAAAGGGSGAGLLAAAAAADRAPRLFALKRVLCGSEDQLAEAQHEVHVMRRLGSRPCLLPLLEAAVQRQATPDGSARQVVLLLFPVYDGGNLFDFVQQQRQQHAQQQRALAAASAAAAGSGGGAAAAAQQRRAAQLGELRTLLQIFLQVCAALHAMHSQEPALAHRDVKPQNVLLRRRQQQQQQPGATADGPGSGGGGGGSSSTNARPGGSGRVAAPYDPVPPIQPLGSSREEDDGVEVGWEAAEWSEASSREGTPAAAAIRAGSSGPAVIAVEPEDAGGPAPSAAAAAAAAQRHQHPGWGAAGQQPDEWWAQRLPAWQERWEAVLMDFGSTRPALIEVKGRSQAMAVQEDAERQCTAPYRAPELWDVASSCTIDERVDVWSLGCLLYFLLCGQSPFERAAGEAGGSLMLAVVNGRLSWPQDVAPHCPESLKQLVARCLDTDPTTRPRVGEVAVAAERILSQLWL